VKAETIFVSGFRLVSVKPHDSLPNETVCRSQTSQALPLTFHMAAVVRDNDLIKFADAPGGKGAKEDATQWTHEQVMTFLQPLGLPPESLAKFEEFDVTGEFGLGGRQLLTVTTVFAALRGLAYLVSAPAVAALDHIHISVHCVVSVNCLWTCHAHDFKMEPNCNTQATTLSR
jgi:hypothetical protein